MAKQVKNINIVSPKGIAVWPKLNEPDTKFNDAGVFETKLLLDPEKPDVQAYIKKMEGYFDAAYEFQMDELGAKGKKFSKRDLFEEELDEEGNETGMILFKYKSTASGTSKTGKAWSRKIPLFDSKRNKIPNSVTIGSGSLIAVSTSFNPQGYAMPSSKEIGLSLKIEAVAVSKLVEYGTKDAAGYGFDEEDDGYSYSNEDAEDQTDSSDDNDDDDADY